MPVGVVTMSTAALPATVVHATSTAPASETPVVVRPRTYTLVTTYRVVFACLVGPPILTLYVLTAPAGTWAYVVLIHLLAFAVIFLIGLCIRRVKLELTPDRISETGLIGRPVHTARSDISSLLLLSVTDGNSARVEDQLFALDASGNTLLRLRGQFWGREAVRAAIAALDIPCTTIDTPKIMSDLRREHGPLLYWHERHPLWRALLLGTGVLLVAGPVLWFCQGLI